MCSECRFLNGGIKMKPMNIKNVLSIGLLLSVFPTFSMITDGSELGRGLLADQETELPHISDHVAITIGEGSSSTNSSPAKSTDGLMSGEKKGCFNRMKAAFNGLPRGVKDTIEISGLTAFTVGASFYGQASGNQYLPVLIAYAAGRTAADVTQRFQYYKKIVPSMLLWVAGGVVYWFFPTSMFVTDGIACAIIMYMVHTTFEDYAVKTGRRNNFTEDFKDLPKDLQEQLIKGVKNVVTELNSSDIEMALSENSVGDNS